MNVPLAPFSLKKLISSDRWRQYDHDNGLGLEQMDLQVKLLSTGPAPIPKGLLYVKPGEVYSVRDLVWIMLFSNDAAVALLKASLACRGCQVDEPKGRAAGDDSNSVYQPPRLT